MPDDLVNIDFDIGLFWATLVMMLALVLGLIRALLGPSLPDRMLSLQLLGTGGVALLLLMANLLNMPSLVDVALILALLAAVATAAVTRRRADNG